ncbi:MAG: hypothetical protein NZ602_07835 [Thermoguttaceae bacterium]|nr:hypothetical protein [Thermoguttaceae bacterium]MDW8039232.1 hypothetical protein [Thermoguttaceae bacterium]
MTKVELTGQYNGQQRPAWDRFNGQAESIRVANNMSFPTTRQGGRKRLNTV